jgi:hypothetical protein
MLILTHIIIATLGLFATGIANIRPSRPLIQSGIALVILTIASGTALVFVSPAHLGQACLMGLAYLAITISGLILAGRRFRARQRA